MKKHLGLVVVLLAVLTCLVGCGFAPLYGARSQGTATTEAALNQVQIAQIHDRSGQMLRNRLIDRMYQNGRPMNAAYELTVRLSEAEAGLGIRRDATASRTRLDTTAHYTLKRKSDGKELINQTIRASVSFNQLDAQYATLTAREDARARALNEIGEQIVNRLALYFGHDTAD